MLLIELLIFLGVWMSSRFLLQRWHSQRKERRRYPPSLPSIPIFGSLPFLRGFNNIADFFMRKSEEIGPIFTFKAGNTVVLILNSREVIEDALVNHSSAFSGRSPVYIESRVNPKSKGLITMNTTQDWKKYHKLSLSILKELGFGVKNMMESRILTELEFITDYVLKQNGASFNPRELVNLSISNIIVNILFGRRHDYNLGMTGLVYHIKRSFDNLDPALDVASIIRFLPFHRQRLNRVVDSHEEMQKIIRTETERIRNDGSSDCFVLRYLKSVGAVYDVDQLNFTLRDLVVAGTDTTGNALLWILVALANNPDVQDRLRTEIDSVIPRDALPSMNDQSRLPFVEATLLEILRWKTAVPLALPHMTLSDTNVGDYFVSAGTLVLVNLYASNMNRKVWKDPETFHPDRFLDKNGQVIGRESVITFSLGRRSCLGEVLARAELFLILTGLVQRFLIRPPEGEDNVKVHTIEPVTIVQASSPFKIRFVARD